LKESADSRKNSHDRFSSANGARLGYRAKLRKHRVVLAHGHAHVVDDGLKFVEVHVLEFERLPVSTMASPSMPKAQWKSSVVLRRSRVSNSASRRATWGTSIIFRRNTTIGSGQGNH
jgi:hypothetical protein